MANKLIDDILTIIVSHLDRVEDLHSALLVNREWCPSAIRRLWRDPFPSPYNAEQGFTVYSSEDYPSLVRCRHNLLTTCFKFLSTTNGHSNYNAFLNLFNLTFRRKSDTISTPLFPYLSYIRVLRLSDVDAAFVPVSQDSTKKMAFISLLLESVTNLEHLSMGDYTSYNLYHKNLLGNVQSVNFGRSQNQKLYHIFSQRHSAITTITIHVGGKASMSTQEIVQYIESFPRLKTFRIIADGKTDDLSKLIQAVCTKADNITEFGVKGGCITRDEKSLEGLLNMHNLKSLFLNDVVSKWSQLEPLTREILPKLETLGLSVVDDAVAHQLISVYRHIVSLNGFSLRNLHLYLASHNHSMIIERISVNCPNLRTLAIRVYNEAEVKALFKLFKACSYLEYFKAIRAEEALSADKIFDYLSRNWPASLRDLDVGGAWKIEETSLHKFLQYCPAPIDRIQCTLNSFVIPEAEYIAAARYHRRTLHNLHYYYFKQGDYFCFEFKRPDYLNPPAVPWEYWTSRAVACNK